MFSIIEVSRSSFSSITFLMRRIATLNDSGVASESYFQTLSKSALALNIWVGWRMRNSSRAKSLGSSRNCFEFLEISNFAGSKTRLPQVKTFELANFGRRRRERTRAASSFKSNGFVR
ncbi:MAG: hypothetical protein C0507_12945 [Cyanobacteria bacterium PR.3.49]|nr:hypothetical protein [Cyanobacteria bacterium PR.3.49]